MSEAKRLQDFPIRNPWLIRGAFVGVGAIAVVTLAWVLPDDSRMAWLFFGRPPPGIEGRFVWPWTIQNLEHLVLFLGLGEFYIRLRIADWELRFAERKFLPEDGETVLQSQDLGPIRQSVRDEYDRDNGWLPNLIDLCILQFQSSRSVQLTSSVLKDALELISHRIDLRYSFSRYIAWLLPTIGFIGTVFGIADTLGVMDEAGDDLSKVDVPKLLAALSVAFDTTIVALIESGIVVLFLHLAQEREERAANLAGDYTLRNLVNRLYSASS